MYKLPPENAQPKQPSDQEGTPARRKIVPSDFANLPVFHKTSNQNEIAGLLHEEFQPVGFEWVGNVLHVIFQQTPEMLRFLEEFRAGKLRWEPNGTMDAWNQWRQILVDQRNRKLDR